MGKGVVKTPARRGHRSAPACEAPSGPRVRARTTRHSRAGQAAFAIGDACELLESIEEMFDLIGLLKEEGGKVTRERRRVLQRALVRWAKVTVAMLNMEGEEGRHARRELRHTRRARHTGSGQSRTYAATRTPPASRGD